MKITALEIKQHEFEKSFRGYDIEEVDIFLNNLASEWERSSNESKMLRMQLEIAEKEAAKLREVEMSLIKTLQNAETTSNKITEQAQITANKQIEDANEEALSLIENAKVEAHSILTNAQKEVSQNQLAINSKEEELRSEVLELETYKADLISQLKAINVNTSDKINSLTSTAIVADVQTETKEEQVTAIVEETAEEIVEENIPTIEVETPSEELQGFSSSANNLVLEEPEENKIEEEVHKPDFDDLTLIEGIGPKIYELLHANGITSFRAIATTPAYKIREVLETAKYNYAMHNPGTWPEQALLAAEGRWEELNALKDHLQGGLEPKVVEPKEETPTLDKKSETTKEVITPKNEQITEEMLDRVNKVKAALRKAMHDKEGTTVAEAAPKTKSINDLAAEKTESAGGSFFDNL